MGIVRVTHESLGDEPTELEGIHVCQIRHELDGRG